MNTVPVRKKIALNSLLLDEKNYRTGDVGSQKEAIHKIIDEQGDKIIRLARSITNIGLSIHKQPCVVVENGKNIVVEGNRRLTCLKVLKNPNLSKGTTKHSQFAKLSKQFKPANFSKIEVVVYPDRDSLDPWRSIDHGGEEAGVGSVDWDRIAKCRHDHDQGVQYHKWLVVVDWLIGRNAIDESVFEGLEKKTSQIDRLLGSGTFEQLTGISFVDDNIIYTKHEDKKAEELLKAILDKIAANKFKTADVNKDPEQRAWLKQFEKLFITPKKGATLVSVPTPPNKKSPPIIPTILAPVPTVPKKTATDRHMFSCKDTQPLDIKNERLIKLYEELCRLNVEKKRSYTQFKEVGSVMNRVFLDLVTEHAIAELGVPKIKDKNDVDREWSTIDLRNKCLAVLRYLEPNNYNKQFNQITGDLKDIWIVVKSTQNTQFNHDIRSLNNYVHNPASKVSSEETKNIFDRYYPYYKAIFNRIV